MQSGYWQDLATTDFQGIDAERTIAVLPVAAIEQHGPHLPLATDTLISAGILNATMAAIGAESTVLVLPALSVGESVEHSDFPGTLSIDAEHLLPVWLAVGRSVARTGVRKLVIFNTHGGQRAIVDLAAMRLRVECGLLVVRANYFSFGAPTDLFEADEWAHGLHGGEVETSLMLHLHPDLVRQDRARDFASFAATLAAKNEWFGAEKPIGFGWKSQDLNPAGAIGNAARADASRGKRYLDYIARALAALLAEVAATPLAVIEDRGPGDGR